MKAGSNQLKMDEKSFLERFAQIQFIMSPLSRMAEIDQMKKRLSCLDQWLVLQIHLMNPKPSTHGDMGWGWASQGYYP